MPILSTPHSVSALVGLALVGTVTACAGRAPEAGPAPAPPAGEARPLRIRNDDSARVAALHSSGVSVQGRRVAAWFPRDSVPEPQMRALVDELDAALPALQRFLGAPYPWQRLGERRIVYYFAPGQFVAHTQDSAVFVALSRLRTGTAPLLHETVHVLTLPSTPYYPWELADSAEVERVRARHPLWFAEGYADYAAKAVAAALPFDEGDVLQTGTHAQVDSICAARLRGPRGAEVARFIGAGGVLESLFTTERREVAPTFYACGSSFTKFLAERTSPQFLASLFPHIIPGHFEGRIRERTGRTLPDLRAEWLQRIGAPEFRASAAAAQHHDHAPAQGHGPVPRGAGQAAR